MHSEQQKVSSRRVKDIRETPNCEHPDGARPPTLGPRSGWTPLPGKRKFPSSKDSGASSLAPAFFRKTLEHRQSRQATVPTVGAEMQSLCPPISRTILPRGAEKARTVNAPISPPSVPYPGLELRVEVPCRGEVGGAITVSLTPNSRFRHPPPSQGTCAGPGAAGAGKGRGGEKRLYSGKEGCRSCRPPAGHREARGCSRRRRFLLEFPRPPPSPRGRRHSARRSRRCARCAQCARARRKPTQRLASAGLSAPR